LFGALVWDGTDNKAYLHNTLGTSAAATPTLDALGTFTLAAQGFRGYVMEVVIVKRAATSGERADMQAYFADKWT
jgi:hypothetical protein